MGWTFFASEGRKPVELLKREVEFETDKMTQKVLDHAVDGSAVYMVVERKPKPDAPWEPNPIYVNDADGSLRWIAVILTERRGGDRFDFGYKDMDETMGPYACTCPPRLIERASPLRDTTDHELNYAHQWRKKCLEHAARKAIHDTERPIAPPTQPGPRSRKGRH